MNRWLPALLVGVSMVFSVGTAAAAAGNAKAGEAISTTCRGCHGQQGISPTPQWPSLAGQGAAYLVKELRDFKAGRRTNAIMSPQAAPLDTRAMDNLAAFFSSFKPNVGTADPKLVAEGGRIYRGGDRADGVPACMACHGPQGKGNPAARYPALRGQHAVYVVSQLEDFKSGKRHNDPNKVMRDIAAQLTPGQMRAVASYIQGLH
ncbi:MAG TPA: cytochrome c4 [Chromatiales bacterium]|nr:cytochrome c4 [Chromatiales bacterium]